MYSSILENEGYITYSYLENEKTKRYALQICQQINLDIMHLIKKRIK